jgi:hypothetical protein
LASGSIHTHFARVAAHLATPAASSFKSSESQTKFEAVSPIAESAPLIQASFDGMFVLHGSTRATVIRRRLFTNSFPEH